MSVNIDITQLSLDFLADREDDIDRIINDAYTDLARDIQNEFLGAYSSGSSLDGQSWAGHAEATTRWRRHFIGVGFYDRVGQEVSVETGDEDELMVVSGMTRDEIADNIYYDVSSRDIVMPDMSNYGSLLSSETVTIIDSNPERPVLVDDAESFIDTFEAESDLESLVLEQVLELFDDYYQENAEFYI